MPGHRHLSAPIRYILVIKMLCKVFVVILFLISCVLVLLGNGVEGSTIFVPCVKQAVFGFFSVNDNSAKSFQQIPNYFHGTKKELFEFLINVFSLPGAIILDMTDCQGKQNV